MTVVYFDSSAFVKLLVEEDGSQLVAELWDGCDAAVSSRLAHPDVRAALAAAGRGGRLTPPDLAHAERSWPAFWKAVRPVELTAAVAAHAADLAGEHALRGADAVHLASALAVGEVRPVVAVWDRRLREAALTAGLHVVPAG